ncbi:hypothetical protein KOR42_30300 [Thalassoglobus neptunius]|uniref:ABC transmembrane type-1 domain-containing protein n=2 Tax=Thalassoglobus neptunius TaxID=1938619 RepID=A0A5C5WNE3_9PLAN|nr:hypothetical protein KOR42_30300 [Thalassoglobus neptunius]
MMSAMAVPFLIPSVMTGYCFRDTSMSLVHHPWMREGLYAAIVLMQLFPVAVIILWLSPPSTVTDSAIHLGRLARTSWSFRFRLALQSRLRIHLTAFCLLFLLSFQEADLASLMQANGWTEWIFTKHSRGLELGETLRLAAFPMVVHLPFLIPIVLWINSPRPDDRHNIRRLSKAHTGRTLLICSWIAASLLVVVLMPTWHLVRGFRFGLNMVGSQPTLIREVSDGILIAATSGCVCLGLVLTLRSTFQTGVPRLLLFLLFLPASMGSLPWGLTVAEIFQTAGFRFAYDTPVPLILSEVLYLLPRAVILFHCFDLSENSPARKMIQLLSESGNAAQKRIGRELHWKFHGRKVFAVALLLSYWSYFEVMLPSILAMPGLAPINYVLYNSLHYGRIAALGVKLAVAIVIPFVLVTVLISLRRLFTRFF